MDDWFEYWVGLSDAGHPDDWRWIQQNCTSTYTFFKGGQPDVGTDIDGDEDCAAVLAYCSEMATDDTGN